MKLSRCSMAIVLPAKIAKTTVMVRAEVIPGPVEAVEGLGNVAIATTGHGGHQTFMPPSTTRSMPVT